MRRKEEVYYVPEKNTLVVLVESAGHAMAVVGILKHELLKQGQPGMTFEFGKVRKQKFIPHEYQKSRKWYVLAKLSKIRKYGDIPSEKYKLLNVECWGEGEEASFRVHSEINKLLSEFFVETSDQKICEICKEPVLAETAIHQECIENILYWIRFNFCRDYCKYYSLNSDGEHTSRTCVGCSFRHVADDYIKSLKKDNSSIKESRKESEDVS